uniref:Fatty acid hydroxylase domain-containing protein n=1 Tax=Monopterus albus TaxID=43700 RepID=A0A3Q3K7Y2_MONAL
ARGSKQSHPSSAATRAATSEGPGGLWDSVKKAVLVIGSGFLFLAAFGNSLTWYLQKFWGASGDFWQNLWTTLYVAFEGHDAALFFLGKKPLVIFEEHVAHVHKQHHEWTAPIGIVIHYAHPLDHVVSDMLPVLIGPLILGSHIVTTAFWFCLVLVFATNMHCGYHLPFLPSPEFHDFHHLSFNQCFGNFGVLDWLHGTDTKFRLTKQYERHILLTSFTPLTESIPDTPKDKLLDPKNWE